MKHITRLLLALVDHCWSNKESQVIAKFMRDSGSSTAIVFCIYEAWEEVQKNIEYYRGISNENDLDLYVIQNENKTSQWAPVEFRRRNKGSDLGAYRDAYFLLKDDYERIIFINDSVSWDWPRLMKLLQHRSPEGTIFMVESVQPFLHFQTFFIDIKGKRSFEEFEAWVKTIRNWRTKTATVLFGELKTSKYFAVPICWFPYDMVLKAYLNEKSDQLPPILSHQILHGVPINPSYSFPQTLISLGFPGRKKKCVEARIENDPKLRQRILPVSLIYRKLIYKVRRRVSF